MTREEATAELKAAGADWVGFNDDRDFLTGIGIEFNGRKMAVAWNRNEDLTQDGVERLKRWIAIQDEPHDP